MNVPEEGYQEAERLLFVHALRAYDSIQLAGALRIVRFLGATGEPLVFMTADQGQARAAEVEGVAVELVV